jgi:ammonia channel protein AmtB
MSTPGRVSRDRTYARDCLAVVSVIWVAFGYSLAFGGDPLSHAGNAIIGNFSHAGLFSHVNTRAPRASPS